MLFRVRTTLVDRPGSLATLTSRCGEAGLNILGLQIFPALGSVVDELVLSAPDDWTAAAVADLVGGAGGDEVSVEPCTTHDLVDQPTRWLSAAAELASGAVLAELLDRLLGLRPERWSATEHSRAAALEALDRTLRGGSGPASAPAGAAGTPVHYAEGETGVEAWIGRHVVGRAHLTPVATEPGTVELVVDVDPSWRRLGIGTSLLHRGCTVAARSGAEEVVLLAAASDSGFVTMVCGTGMRARIRSDGGVLTARIRLVPGTAGATRGTSQGTSRAVSRATRSEAGEAAARR